MDKSKGELEIMLAECRAARDAAEAKAKHNFNAWRAAENEMLAVAAQRDRLAAALREIAAEFPKPGRTYAGPANACEKVETVAREALSVLDRETPDSA